MERPAEVSFPPKPKSYEALIKPARTTYLPNDVIERAMLHYRAQMIASNDLVRAYLHRKWSENANVAPPRVPAATAFATHVHPSAWAPLIGGFRQYDSIATKKLDTAPEFNGHKRLCPSNSTDSNTSRSSVIMRHSSPFSVSTSPPCSPPTASPPDVAPFSPILSPQYVLNVQSPNSQTRFSPGALYGELPERQVVANAIPTTDSPPPHIEQKAANKRRRAKRNPNGQNSSTSGDTYPCSICGASYPHKFELNRHVKVSHVRPHRCGQCGKGFGHRNYLKVHIETVHMGRKTHQCRLCGKYLSTGGNLNVHVRTIHLGEKKYNCPVCNRSFGQQCNMKTHMKRHFSKADDI